MKLVKKLGFFSVPALLSGLLLGCNTMHGVGEDLSAGGKALSQAAKNAKGDSNQNSSQAKA